MIQRIASHRRTWGWTAGLVLTALGTLPLHATEIVFADWVSKITMKGDFRLRQETFHKKGQASATTSTVDRSRQRFRLRLQAEIPVNDQLKTVFGLASGTGEQVSTNQSFDNLSSQKQLWIDLAYLDYKPMEALKLRAGRMTNPLWRTYTSDIVWDGDFNPEGFSQNLSLTLFGHGRFFLNGLQGVADEDSSTNNDQWYLTGQTGVILPLPMESRLTLSGALHEWVHESSATFTDGNFPSNATFGQTTVQGGNRRLGATGLANEFRIMEITAEYLMNVANLPLSLQGTFVKNTAHRDASVFTDKTLADTGSQWGLIFGKAGKKGTWETAYFHKQVAADAVVADIADSDFGEGGTNRRGHIGWVSYAPADSQLVSLKVFNTKVNDTKFTSGRLDDINRFQLDYSVKF